MVAGGQGSLPHPGSRAGGVQALSPGPQCPVRSLARHDVERQRQTAQATRRPLHWKTTFSRQAGVAVLSPGARYPKVSLLAGTTRRPPCTVGPVRLPDALSEPHSPPPTHTPAARCVTLGESRNLSVPEAPAPVVWRTTPLGVHRTPPERPTSGLPPLPPFLRLPVRGDPGEADPFLSSPAVHTFPNAALQRPRDAAACASGRLL